MLHSRSIFQQARQNEAELPMYQRFETRKVSSICEGLFRKFLSLKKIEVAFSGSKQC